MGAIEVSGDMSDKEIDRLNKIYENDPLKCEKDRYQTYFVRRRAGYICLFEKMSTCNALVTKKLFKR